MSSKQEYLKRYLSGPAADERKDRKKKKKRRKGAISIRDDTDDWEKNEERRRRLERKLNTKKHDGSFPFCISLQLYIRDTTAVIYLTKISISFLNLVYNCSNI